MLKAQTYLKNWYLINNRPLPWRTNRNPYYIWISEVMLQQTTVQTVIPFYLKFIEAFPNVKSLADANLPDVFERWAGLGYYSRARNLHKSAKQISQLKKFPTKYSELIKLPGFGDYTARAVSSIAFDEPVGVVDGNVIRILSRLNGIGFSWWKSEDKKKLQTLADNMCSGQASSTINQAMMELGATICTPSSPACPICPWLKICLANKNNLVESLPQKRPKKANQLVALELSLLIYQNEIALMKNESLPFLRGTLLPHCKMTIVKKKPTDFNFQHSITHFKIFVTIKSKVLSAKAAISSKHLKQHQ